MLMQLEQAYFLFGKPVILISIKKNNLIKKIIIKIIENLFICLKWRSKSLKAPTTE